MAKNIEDLIIKFVIASIGKISYTRITWFFYDSRSFSMYITSEYSKLLRIFDFFTECCISFLFCKCQYIISIIDIIARYNGEFSLYMSTEFQNSSSSSHDTSLLDVVDFFTLIRFTEVFPE